MEKESRHGEEKGKEWHLVAPDATLHRRGYLALSQARVQQCGAAQGSGEDHDVWRSTVSSHRCQLCQVTRLQCTMIDCCTSSDLPCDTGTRSSQPPGALPVQRHSGSIRPKTSGIGYSAAGAGRGPPLGPRQYEAEADEQDRT